jgi:hypothetical protein
MTYSRLTRDERRNRIDELREWLTETNEEFRDEPFPPDVQLPFDRAWAELEDHERQLRNLEERDRKLEELHHRFAGLDAEPPR